MFLKKVDLTHRTNKIYKIDKVYIHIPSYRDTVPSVIPMVDKQIQSSYDPIYNLDVCTNRRGKMKTNKKKEIETIYYIVYVYMM